MTSSLPCGQLSVSDCTQILGSGATVGPQGPPGPQGPQGPAGQKGEDGTSVTITGSVATETDLPAAGSNGDGYIVEDTGDLWLWTDDGGDGTGGWTDVGQVRGPEGPDGPAGPQGIDGPQGDPGPEGPAGPAGPTGPAAPATDGGQLWQNYGVRELGVGQQLIGFEFPYRFILERVSYAMGTADASGTTTVELRRGATADAATAISGTRGPASVSPAPLSGLSVTINAGDLIWVYVTALGDTPGRGLAARFRGTRVN